MKARKQDNSCRCNYKQIDVDIYIHGRDGKKKKKDDIVNNEYKKKELRILRGSSENGEKVKKTEDSKDVNASAVERMER